MALALKPKNEADTLATWLFIKPPPQHLTAVSDFISSLQDPSKVAAFDNSTDRDIAAQLCVTYPSGIAAPP